MDKITIREMADELWRLFFVIFKGLSQVVAASVYIGMLVLFFFMQRIYFVARSFYVLIDEWTPIKPTIFEVE